MSAIARFIGRKAAKATLRHSARGLASRAKREPLRSATLLSIGAAFGAGVGWLAGHRT